MIRDIEHIYQQWCSGNDYCEVNWLEFVKLAAKYQRTTVDAMQVLLKAQEWFLWRE
jgi:hypothetical protein